MPPVEQQVKIVIDTELRINSIKKAITHLDKLREAGALTNDEYQNSLDMLEKQEGGYYKIALKMKNQEIALKKLNKQQQDAAKNSRRMTSAYLSLMFTGMALTRVFGGMVKSVLDVLGVSDMLSATLLVTLLPALEPVSDMLFNIMDFFMNLPEPVQKVIGGFVLLASAIGYLFTFIGMFGTFFAGGWAVVGKAITALWGLLTGFVSWVAGALGVSFGAAFAIIAAIIAAVVALITGAIAAWKNNFLGFKDAVIGVWEAIKTIIGGFVTFFKGIWDVIAGIFTGNFDRIKQGFGLMGEGIKNIFKGIANFVINIINALVGLILSALAQIIRPIQWIWNKVPGHSKVTWYEDIMSAGAGKGLIPSFATGGVMPYTGLAQLHAGETITPAGQSINSAPTINIQASISNDYDVRRLADQLSKYWVNDMERISKSRGMI